MFGLKTWTEGDREKKSRDEWQGAGKRVRTAGALCTPLLCLLGVGLYFRSLFVERAPLCERNTEAGLPVCAKLLVVVADGVRPDAVFASTGAPSRYHGNLPFLAQLEQKGTGRAYAAVADLPTGTAMRIYSIFSGVPTTLLAAQQSFAAQACTTDNFVAQLLACGKTAAFYGDSTWTRLFPEVKTLPGETSEPYGLVDPAEEERLISGALRELGEKDVVLVHLISPDSYGHVYGVDSEQVQASLRRINQFLEDAHTQLRALHRDTGTHSAIAVLSDHGVNNDGSHGGASVKERSAIFGVVFPHLGGHLGEDREGEGSGTSRESPSGALRDTPLDTLSGTARDTLLGVVDVVDAAVAQLRTDHAGSVRAEDIQGAFELDPAEFAPRCVVSQNDVLPTLSALLGVPTPYNASGSPIPELLPAGRQEDVLQRETARKEQILRRCGETPPAQQPGVPTVASRYAADLELGQRVHRLFHSHSVPGMAVGASLVGLGALSAASASGLAVLSPVVWASLLLAFLVAHSMYAVIHEDVLSVVGLAGSLLLRFGVPRRRWELGCAALLPLSLLVGRFPLHEMDRFWWVIWIPKLAGLAERQVLGQVGICLGSLAAWVQRRSTAQVLLLVGRALRGHPSRTLLLAAPAFPGALLLLPYTAGPTLFLLALFCPLVRAVAAPGGKSLRGAAAAQSACALFFLLKLAFFATGHNHNLSTINWEAAFALSKQPLPGASPLLVLGDLLFPHLFVVWSLGTRQKDVLGGVVALQGACVFLGCAVNFWFLGHSLLWFVFAGRTIFESVFLLVLSGAYALVVGVEAVQQRFG